MGKGGVGMIEIIPAFLFLLDCLLATLLGVVVAKRDLKKLEQDEREVLK